MFFLLWRSTYTFRLGTGGSPHTWGTRHATPGLGTPSECTGLWWGSHTPRTSTIAAFLENKRKKNRYQRGSSACKEYRFEIFATGIRHTRKLWKEKKREIFLVTFYGLVCITVIKIITMVGYGQLMLLLRKLNLHVIKCYNNIFNSKHSSLKFWTNLWFWNGNLWHISCIFSNTQEKGRNDWI